MSSSRTGLFLALLCLVASYEDVFAVDGVLQLPDTSGIDGQLTANHGVDHFFSLWLVFNNDEVKMSGEPFTILAPKNKAFTHDESVLRKPELVKKLLLDHVVLGKMVDLTNTTEAFSFKTLGGKTVEIQPEKEGKLKANNANVIEPKIVVPNGLLIVLDNYLFAVEHKSKTNSSHEKLDVGIAPVVNAKETPKINSSQNTTFVENIMQVLSFLKSGVRVFQHFLSRSNVSQLLVDGEEYTVFVPTDHAFQRWHPIDWGFYPFSVPEFTESVIINHFIKGRLKQENIKDGQTAKTLGGREVVFRKTPTLTVNGATIIKGDTPVIKGNIMFVGEVLFVSEAVVSRLHQQHRDKETPPLLAFPWFGAQFLSHAFLALERDKRFSHITRFLNLADLAPHVSGTGYTFFVPTDTAFEELGFDKMPDNYLSTGDGLQILLNHFVKGRLYDKDLKDGTRLNSLGNKTINIERKNEKVMVNDATIIESEVFVYNLGTMFYIDKVLFTNLNSLPTTTVQSNDVITEAAFTTPENVELVSEHVEAPELTTVEQPETTLKTNSNKNVTIN